MVLSKKLEDATFYVKSDSDCSSELYLGSIEDDNYKWNRNNDSKKDYDRMFLNVSIYLFL